MKIKVHIRLDKSGQIIGEPEAVASGGPAPTQEALRGAAERAVLRSQADFQKEVDAGNCCRRINMAAPMAGTN